MSPLQSNFLDWRKSTPVLASAVCLLGLLADTAYCYKRPIVTLDTMAYVSIIEQHQLSNFQVAGRDCSLELPGEHTACSDVISESSYEQISRYSSADFATFLRFYEVKPLYTWLVSIVYKTLHLSAFTALRVVSAGSFFLMALVLWCWVKEYLPATSTSFAVLFIATSPQVLDLGKYLLPDGFCDLLLMLAVYFLLHKSPKWLGAVFLFLLPFSRTDYLIFAALFGATLIYQSDYPLRQKRNLMGLLILVCLLIQIVLQRTLHSLPYPVLFKHSFVAWTNPSSFPGTRLSLREYLGALALYGSKTLLIDLPQAAFLATVALASPNGRPPLKSLVLVAVAAVSIRVLLFPGMEVRYYVWFYIISAVAVCGCLAAKPQARTLKEIIE